MAKDLSSPYDIGIVYRDLTTKDPKFRANQDCPLCGLTVFTPGISMEVKKRSSGTNHYILFEPDQPVN